MGRNPSSCRKCLNGGWEGEGSLGPWGTRSAWCLGRLSRGGWGVLSSVGATRVAGLPAEQRLSRVHEWESETGPLQPPPDIDERGGLCAFPGRSGSSWLPWLFF